MAWVSFRFRLPQRLRGRLHMTDASVRGNGSEKANNAITIRLHTIFSPHLPPSPPPPTHPAGPPQNPIPSLAQFVTCHLHISVLLVVLVVLLVVLVLLLVVVLVVLLVVLLVVCVCGGGRLK